MGITIRPKQKSAKEYKKDAKTPILTRGRSITDIVNDINERMYK